MAATPASATVECRPWAERTITDGLGSLENLEPDGAGGAGGLLISAHAEVEAACLPPAHPTPAPGAEAARLLLTVRSDSSRAPPAACGAARFSAAAARG